MIKTIADFLDEFKRKSLDKIEIDDKDVTHNPTIGNIFEGLTSSILNKSIFDGLNLRIVNNSFIFNDLGEVSPEMDCMIVIGDGVQINFTNQFKYHFKSVVAVIQVKKTLNSTTYIEAHENLLSSIKINTLTETDLYLDRLHEHAFKQLVGKSLPYPNNLGELNDSELIVYHMLKMQAYYPLRIMIGYYGYQSEFSFRKGIMTAVSKQLGKNPTAGLNPVRFADLIICGNQSIVKCSGMPFGRAFLDNEFYWLLLASSNERPMYFLLEFIWTKISYMFRLSSKVFGDDFDYEALHPLVLAKDERLSGDSWKWYYLYNELSQNQLKDNPVFTTAWAPVEINDNECTMLSLLIDHPVMVDDKLLTIFNNDEAFLQQSLSNLNKNRIITIDDKSISFLIEIPQIVFHKGLIYIGENKSGEMSNWNLKLLKSNNEKRPD